MIASSGSLERMQVVKSVLAGVMVAALVLCAIAATASDPDALSQSKRKPSFSARALSAVRQFQGLADDAAILSSVNGTNNDALVKPKIYSNEQMDMEGQRWMFEHPQQAQVASLIWNIGLLLMLLALIVVIYSEVSTVLFFREMDGIIAADITAAPASADMRLRQDLWGKGWNSVYRPGMTMGGVAVLMLTMMGMFYSQCPMIDDIKSEFDISDTSYDGSCALIALKQAVITAMGIIFFLVGLAWCCTRFLPAFLMLLLSLGADIAGSYNGAVPVLLWILAVFAAGALYLWVLRKSDDEEAVPAAGKKKDNLEFV